MNHEYGMGKKEKGHLSKAKLTQFPLTLAWAITAHKCQGQTIKPPKCLVADIADMFGPGMTYVVLGRVQNINQLYLLSFDEEKIKVSQEALQEAEKISRMSRDALLKDTFLQDWIASDQKFENVKKIATLNVRSLGNRDGHIADVRADYTLLDADILCLTETWLPNGAVAPPINGFRCQVASQGRGKGVAVYVREGVPVLSTPKSVVRDAFQMIRVDFPDLILIAVYRSPSHTSSEEKKDFIRLLTDVQPLSKPAVVCGDMNIPLNTSQGSNILSLMGKKGFKQLVDYPTHIKGNILDHVYVRYPKSTSLMPPSYRLHFPYYSDHEAPLLILKSKSEGEK